MKAFTNTNLIETRAKWAKRIAPLTMLFLVGGLITNFMSINQPQYFRVTVLLLAIGFLLSLVSSSLVNQWVREPRTDQALATTLKKFGHDFVLFNYTTVVHHVLLTPSRLYVIVARRHSGQISVNRDRFSRKFSWVRVLRFFADEGMGRPTHEAQSKAKKLGSFLSSQLNEEEIPDIAPLVIFTNKEAELSVSDPVIPIMRLNALKTYLREQDKIRAVSAKQRNTLIKLLSNDYQEVTK